MDKKQLTIILLILALISQSLGGIMDMTGKRIWYVSREHAFADGLFLLVLAIGINLIPF